MADDFQLKDDGSFDFSKLEDLDIYNFFIRAIQNFRKSRSETDLEQVKIYYNQLKSQGYLNLPKIKEIIDDILVIHGLYSKVASDFKLRDDDFII